MKVDDEIEVYLDDASRETPRRVGTLRPSFMGGRSLAASSFEYEADYLGSAERYAISPELPLAAGRIYTAENQSLFGAFSDAAPDEWGQKIIQANHALLAKQDSSIPLRLGEFDYLLGVSDATRMGALRFRRSQSVEWMSSDAGVANVHDIRRILEATRRYEAHEASDEDVELLAGVATSPGGARPKANVLLENGHLALAKLPHSKDDNVDVEAWEAVVTAVARSAGLLTARFTSHRLTANNTVYVTERFDRGPDGRRIAYLSAASALRLGRHVTGVRVTYEEFADTLAELSSQPQADLAEMFGRIALTVLVNNVDDHWRNHGFLRGASGWRLSPLFDVNPKAQRGVFDSRPISDVDDPRDRDLRNLIAVRRAFGLSEGDARGVIRAIALEVSRWPTHAAEQGIADAEVRAMAPAFEGGQLSFALDL